MPPRFERTLKALVTPALATGQNVAVVCLPSVRRMTQKATWTDHWNRRFGNTFTFVNRCLCAFAPDTKEHRSVFVGTNVSLPTGTCDRVPHRGSTTGQARHTTTTIILALIALVGCIDVGRRVLRPPVMAPAFIPSPTLSSGSAYHGQALGLTRLESTGNAPAGTYSAVTLTTPELPNSGGVLPTEQDTCETRDTQLAYPTDAKEREKVRRKKQKDEGKEHTVKKKKKVVEEHYDDCGEDLASLHDTDVVGFAYPDNVVEEKLLRRIENEIYLANAYLFGDPIPMRVYLNMGNDSFLVMVLSLIHISEPTRIRRI